MKELDQITSIKIPSWRYEEIEKRVVDLYVEQKINKIPINPFNIIKNKGYLMIPFSTFENPITQSSFEEEENDAFSFYSPKDKTYIITYDDEKPLIRLRFTLMHEIGHIVLGHKCESELARKEADYFAAYALAPSPLIYYLIKEDTTINTIGQFFWISKQCVEICTNRYINWALYGGPKLKKYEEKIINLFK